jgi:hypothetical protein
VDHKIYWSRDSGFVRQVARMNRLESLLIRELYHTLPKSRISMPMMQR